MILTVTDKVDGIAQFITVLVIFVLVLGMTAFVTKWIAGYQKAKLSTGNMEVIETLRISTNKFLQIVRVGNKYLAIAVCKDTITMLTEVPEEQMDLERTVTAGNFNFRDFLEKAKQNNSGKDQ